MARLAVSVAGAAAGFALGGPTGARIGWAIGSMAGGALFPADPVEARGPRIEDGKVTSSAYGQPIPKLWGVTSIAGNIIDASELREKKKTSEQGGKDFGAPTQTTTTYSYSADIAVALCEGEIDGIVQIYANESLIYDATPGATVVAPDWLAFTLYTGTETQLPDPTLEAIHGADNVPAYRGLAYVVFKGFKLGNSSIATNFRFVVAKSATNSVSESSLTLPGPLGGVGISPRTQVVVMSTNYAAAQTGGDDVVVLTGIDPFSRAIAWQTSITDADDFYTNGDPIPCVHPSYQGIQFMEQSAICVPTKGYPTTAGHLAFYDAVTGALINRYAVQDYAVQTHVAFLRPLFLSAIQLTSNTLSVVSLTLLGFAEDTFSTTDIDPPIGYVFTRPGCNIASNDEGLVLVPAETTGGDPAVVIVNAASGLVDSVTGVGIGTDLAAILSIVWDSSRGLWWVFGQNTGTGNDGTVFWSVDDAGTATEYDLAVLHGESDEVSIADGTPVLYLDQLNGVMWWHDTNGDAHSWNPSAADAPVEYAGGTNEGGLVYHRGTRTTWGAHLGTAYGLHTVGLTGDAASLQSVVEDLCSGTELVSADYDASALSGVAVNGFSVSRQMSRRDAVQALRNTYLFDFVPRDAVLTGILRGATSVATLDEDDLGAHIEGSDAPEPITIRAIGETGLPYQVDLTYISAAQNYEPMTQSARRLASAGGTVSAITIPVVLSEDDGIQLADTLLHLQHIGAEQYEGAAMPSQSGNCQPGNVITASLDGESYTWRLESASIVDGGIVELKGQRDDASLYSSFAVGGTPRARSRTVLAAGVTLFWPLDLPMLRAADDDAGVYAAFGSYTPGWPGCEIYQSLDGETFSLIDSHTTHASFGVVLNATTAVDSMAWDLDTTLSVRAINSTFASSAWATAISAGNLAAWGQAGRWEIVAFTTAAQQGDGSWNISGLARGLRDTLGNAGSHVAGDLFILLGESELARLSWSADQYNVSRSIKAATVGTFLADAIAQSVTPSAQALLPFAPCRLHASLSGTTWSLSWMRQDRQITRFWQQPTSSEASESYQIRILDSLGVVLNTRTSTSASLSYDSSMQTADYGGEVTAVYFQVAQVSAITGAGHWSDICAVVFEYPLVDISGTATAYVSNGDYNTSYLKDYAFDDNSSTQWQSVSALSSTANYVGCQFSTAETVSQVTIQQTEFGASGYGYASEMAIEYSDNGSTWTTADTVTLVQDESVQPFDLPASGSHTYWRCRATNWDVGGYRWAVKEIEFMAPDGP